MAEFSPLKTGQLVVRMYSPWRRRATMVLAVLLMLAVPYATYEFGRWYSGYSIVAVTQERLEHAERVRKLEQQVAALQSGVASAELSRNVDRESYESVEKTLADLQAQVREQRDELAFYQAIVSPKEGPSGPRVQSVSVTHGALADHYQLKLLLIQSLLQEAMAGGSLKVELAGTRGGQPATLSLADVAVDEHVRNDLPFSFRYFQELEQEIVLPADFAPTNINVEVKSSRQAAVKQSFGWQPEEKG
jgi:hypothetical protein